MLGTAQVHGRWRQTVAGPHAILIPGRARTVLVWVGATVAGSLSGESKQKTLVMHVERVVLSDWWAPLSGSLAAFFT